MSITEIKKSARLKLSGNYIRCASSSLLYFIMVTLLTFFQTKIANSIKSTILLSIVQAIFLLINWILGYGIIANILDLVNVKTNSITDFINSTLKNCVKYTKVGLRTLIKILVPLFLFLLSVFYWLGTVIAKTQKVDFLCFYQNLIPLATCICILTGILLIYFILKYALIAYIYHEDSSLKESEIISKSNNLMKKNKFKYILLLLSFLHWLLIAALILMILNIFIPTRYLTPFVIFFYSIIRPYVVVSKNEFYKELDEKKEN